nr:immunoglobulin light chain junction region [Macaca mulatta]
CMESLEFPLTF